MDTHSIRERFSHKIKSIDEVRAVVGVYPREKSVVMCTVPLMLFTQGTSGICCMRRARQMCW